MLSGDLQLEMEARGEGEFLNAARYRMRDAEDELNLPGDVEGLMEAYQWAWWQRRRPKAMPVN